MMRSRVLVALIGMSLLLTACLTGGSQAAATPPAMPMVKADTAVIAEGRLEPVYYAEIASNTSGVIAEVLVAEGEPVHTGQPLIRLGSQSNSSYADARYELASARKALNDLLSSSGTQAAQAVIDLKDAQEAFDKAADYLSYLQSSNRIPQVETRAFRIPSWRGYTYVYKTKDIKAPAPEDWIVEAQNDLALKQAELDAARNTYERLKGGTDGEELAVLQARLEAAEAGVAAFEVSAPFDGVVADLHAKLGSSIAAGETAMTVADFSRWLVVTTDLTELDVVALSQDQPVQVRLDAIPGLVLPGRILSIGQTYAENQGDIVYEVTILLEKTDPAMRWGMTAEVSFEDQD